MFSYICPACNRAINGDEVCHLRHIRHGVVLGETVGYYDGYGRTYGNFSGSNSDYRCDKSDAPSEGYENTHEEICASEFEFLDSEGFNGRIFNGEPVRWVDFCKKNNINCYREEIPQSIYDLWDSLEKYEPSESEIKSGTSAYHEYCWQRLSNAEKEKNIISKGDPNQGWGTPLELYTRKEE